VADTRAPEAQSTTILEEVRVSRRGFLNETAAIARTLMGARRKTTKMTVAAVALEATKSWPTETWQKGGAGRAARV
jgi:uncharacterized OB-fold protein